MNQFISEFISYLVPFNISSRISAEEPTEEKETILFCDYTQINEKNIKSLKWYNHDLEISNSSIENVTIAGNQLKFSYLNHSIHNGIYRCQIKLTNDQIFSSNNFNMTIYCMFSFRASQHKI